MPDRKIYLNGTSVPLYWTGEEEDGKKEYKNPCGCCCPFYIYFEVKEISSSAVLANENGTGGFLDQNAYTTISSSFSYNVSSTTTPCPVEENEPYTFTRSEIGSGSYSLILTRESSGGYISKSFERPPDQSSSYIVNVTTCENGDCTDSTFLVGHRIGQGFDDNPSDNSASYSSSYTVSQTCEDLIGGVWPAQNEDQSSYSFSVSSNLSGLKTKEDIFNLAFTGFNGQDGGGEDPPWTSSAQSIYYNISVLYRFGGASAQISGPRKYRLKYKKTATGYLKVWLKKLSDMNGIDLPSQSVSVVISVPKWSEGDTCSSSQNEYLESEEFAAPTISIPTLDGGVGYYNIGIFIEKYSFVEGYEPDISDPDNRQPNGFPDPNWEPSPP
jgi:hypothetical protein